jgi:glucose uptake protein
VGVWRQGCKGPCVFVVSVDSYPVAVALCILTMLCWGSWSATQKLATRQWRFQLFYWDYSIGIVVVALLFAFTLGSAGPTGRPFLEDLAQADRQWLGSAFLGGVVFNLSNILLVAAIDVAGIAVAFPIGVGLALVLGILTTYVATGTGDVRMLAAGAGAIVIAIVLDALAYRRLIRASKQLPARGIALSVIAGALMGWFYSFVAKAIGTLEPSTHDLTAGRLSAYTALVLFSFGLFLSNFLWNSFVMARPFSGESVSYRDYFERGNARLHLIGILGGAIWNLGFGFNLIASRAAGPALSYGLGQGATLVGAIWGVFVWKEFKGASRGTNRVLGAMFAFYLLGLCVLVASKL